MAVTEVEQAPPQEGKLRLPSLEIRNFRVFDHLRIEALGRVNLITGRNNVGKTSVLEAVYLYARAGGALSLHEILFSRDEFAAGSVRELSDESWLPASDRGLALSPLTIKYLFHGRKDFGDFPEPIHIGPVGETDQTLQIEARWYRVLAEKTNEGHPVERFEPLSPGELKSTIDPMPRVAAKMGQSPVAYYSLAQLSDRHSYPLRMGLLAQEKHALFVRPGGLDGAFISRLWNLIQLSPLEDEARAALQMIAPDVERVSVRIDRGASQGPVPIIKVKGSDEPFPLRTMGEGMVRLFAIVLALVSAKDGFLLLDEVENGLHYSVQPDVWRLIFRVAQTLNVQVLATTHSWDCIEAFQKSAAEDASIDGRLIRLEELHGNIVATSFDRDDLAVITRDYLEVR